MKIKVGDIQNIQSWAGSDLIKPTDIKDEVGRFLLSLRRLDVVRFGRSQEITVLKSNGRPGYKFPAEAENLTTEEDEPSTASDEWIFRDHGPR